MFTTEALNAQTEHDTAEKLSCCTFMTFLKREERMRGSEAITYLRTEAIFSVKGTVRIRNKCGVKVEFVVLYEQYFSKYT